jgi:hypothetical protein
MYDRESALKNIHASIDRINEQLPPGERIVKADTTILVGAGSTLESLTLINLMVEIEETVAAAQGRRLSILEGALMHGDGARFSTVDDLALWIAEQP